MKRIITRTSGVAILFIVWSLTMAIGAAAAHAQQIVEIEFDVQEEVLRAPPQTHRLLTQNISAENVGKECALAAIADNNSSEHQGNDLVVTSGGSTVTLFDVERENGARTDGDGLLTLGTTVTIDMVLGEDDVSSGGYRVFALCQPLVECTTSPALSIVVAPAEQEVDPGGDASFDVTVTNTGDEPFASVNVDASVDVGLSVDGCDQAIGALGVGAATSYSCTAEGVETDFDLVLTGNAQGEDAMCEAVGAAQARVNASSSQACTTNPALTVTVAPADQDVPEDGDATFQVTVKNSGDDDLVNVAVVSSVAACDKSVGNLAVGAEFSYSCTAAGVGGDLSVSFEADGEGVSDREFCLAEGSAGATVGNPPPPTTKPPTTTPKTPTGVPTGIGEAGSPAVPIGALAVVALGITVLGVGTYRIARKER
jgi:hypothetical protein